MKSKLQHTNTGFKIPENYFDSFASNLESKLNRNLNLNTKTVHKTGFTLPDTYFIQFESRLLSKLNEKPVMNLTINKYWISGIAALFLVSIMLPIFYHAQDVKQTHNATKEYLEIHADELSTYEVGILLHDSEIDDLENDLIYNNI